MPCEPRRRAEARNCAAIRLSEMLGSLTGRRASRELFRTAPHGMERRLSEGTVLAAATDPGGGIAHPQAAPLPLAVVLGKDGCHRRAAHRARLLRRTGPAIRPSG